MHPTEGGVTVLLGGTNPQISPQFYYALGKFILSKVMNLFQQLFKTLINVHVVF